MYLCSFMDRIEVIAFLVFLVCLVFLAFLYSLSPLSFNPAFAVLTLLPLGIIQTSLILLSLNRKVLLSPSAFPIIVQHLLYFLHGCCLVNANVSDSSQ